jgi:predicted nuclease of predicted toxin-antitoxin system
MPWVSAIKTAKHNLATKKEINQVLDYYRRKAKPKFYADENFPAAAIRLIRSRGAHVLTAHDANLKGHPDENHAAFALKSGRVLLTCDRDFLDQGRFRLIHCPVIVICDFGLGTSLEMRLTFRCLRAVFRVPQFYDKWMKIDAKRQSWIESCRYLNGTTSRTRYRIYGRQLQEWVE